MLGGSRRWRVRLRHSAPLVATLVVLNLVEMAVADSLSFGLFPTRFFLAHDGLDAWWQGALHLLTLAAVVLWLTGLLHELREVACALLGAYTLALVVNVAQLTMTLQQRGVTDALNLLSDGALIWLSNVGVFAAWYWLLDAGGPERRAEGKWAPRDFLFPQQAAHLHDYRKWRPGFVDYLFLAFTTSSALGPTDTQTLSRRAKLAQMSQTALSLLVVLLVVARAINIIPMR